MRRTVQMLVMGAGLFLPTACVTGSEVTHEQAFQACKQYTGTEKFNTCTREKINAYNAEKSARAEDFKTLRDDCDHKRAEAGARGADPDKVSCHGDSPLEYVLDGVN